MRKISFDYSVYRVFPGDDSPSCDGGSSGAPVEDTAESREYMFSDINLLLNGSLPAPEACSDQHIVIHITHT